MGIYSQSDHDRAVEAGGIVCSLAVALAALALLLAVVAWA